FDGSVIADVDLFGRRHVAGHLSEHDHGLREYLRFDLAVGSDGQDVFTQLDLALDVPLDRQILAASQLALYYNRFADVHDVPFASPRRRRHWPGRYRR